MGYFDYPEMPVDTNLPIFQDKKSLLSSISWSTLTSYILIPICLIVIWFFKDSYFAVLDSREKRHRLQFRRRHGIPDSDDRNFVVAYADAVRSKQQRARSPVPRTPQAPPRQGRSETVSIPQVFGNDFKPREDLEESPASTVDSLRRLEPSNYDKRENQISSTPARFPNWIPYNNISSPIKSRRLPERSYTYRVIDNLAVESSSARDRDKAQSSKGEKHTRDEDGDMPETSKKFRMEDGDEKMDWEIPQETQNRNRKVSDPKRLRGHKRQANLEDDEPEMKEKSSRDKRARKVSRNNKASQDHEVADDVDTFSAFRGKKRDRFEAGSTFGGDDDLVGKSGKKIRKHRRRLAEEENDDMTDRKQSSALSSTADDDDEEKQRLLKSYRKKIAKQSTPVSRDAVSSDTSMSEVQIVADPFCKGHRIGEEWEANGRKWKVGPDGRRLRQVLLKRKKSRYSMPQDSEHPDSKAHLAFAIEVWLTDEEFKTAEEKGDLYKPTEDDPVSIDTAVNEEQKSNSLWSSSRRSATLARMALRNSLVSNVGLNVNPFEQQPTIIDRRVLASQTPTKNSLKDVPKLRPSHSYSKWQKQDMEAEAIAKLRRKLEMSKSKEAGKPEQPLQSSSLPGTSAAAVPSTVPFTSQGSASSNSITFVGSETQQEQAIDKILSENTPTGLFPTQPDTSQPVAPPAFSFSSKDAVSSSDVKSDTKTTSSPFAFGNNQATASAAPSVGAFSLPSAEKKEANTTTIQNPAIAPNRTFSFGNPGSNISSDKPTGSTVSGTTSSTQGGSSAAPSSIAFLSAPTMVKTPFGESASQPSQAVSKNLSANTKATAPTFGFAARRAASAQGDISKEISAPEIIPQNTTSDGNSGAETAAPSSTPKFSFGFGDKSSKPVSISNNAANVAAPSTAGASQISGQHNIPPSTSQAPKFSFGISNSNQSSTSKPFAAFVTGNASAEAKEPVSSESTGNPFGSNNIKFSEAPSFSNVFGGTGFAAQGTSQSSGSQTQSLFGGSTSTSAQSVFGSPQKNAFSSPFQSSSIMANASDNTAKASIFGNSSAATPRPAFSFGIPGGASSSTPNSSNIFGKAAGSGSTDKMNTDVPKSMFGATSHLKAPVTTNGFSTAENKEAPKFSFNFGGPSTNAAPNSSNSSATPSQGPSNATNPFAFKAPTSNTPFNFSFGGPPQSSEKK